MVKTDDYRADMIDCVTLYAEKNNMNLIIQTSGSTIIGKSIDVEEKVNPLFDVMMETFEELRSGKIKELEKDSNGQLSTRAIFLKDVTIMNSNRVNLPFLIVFADEISAISLGDTAQN